MMRNIIGFFRVLSPLILLGVALLGAHYFFSVEAGAPCAQDFECRHPWKGVCVHPPSGSPYCSEKCENSADCPSGWLCEPIVTEYSQQGRRWSSEDTAACLQATNVGQEPQNQSVTAGQAAR